MNFSNASFLLVPQNLTWRAAQKYCDKIFCGATLAMIRSEAQQKWVQTLIQQYSQYSGQWFMGATDVVQDGAWRWPDGSEVSYTAWRTDAGKPSAQEGGDCGALNADGSWSDAPCRSESYFVCGLQFCNAFDCHALPKRTRRADAAKVVGNDDPSCCVNQDVQEIQYVPVEIQYEDGPFKENYGPGWLQATATRRLQGLLQLR